MGVGCWAGSRGPFDAAQGFELYTESKEAVNFVTMLCFNNDTVYSFY